MFRTVLIIALALLGKGFLFDGIAFTSVTASDSSTLLANSTNHITNGTTVSDNVTAIDEFITSSTSLPSTNERGTFSSSSQAPAITTSNPANPSSTISVTSVATSVQSTRSPPNLISTSHHSMPSNTTTFQYSTKVTTKMVSSTTSPQVLNIQSSLSSVAIIAAATPSQRNVSSDKSTAVLVQPSSTSRAVQATSKYVENVNKSTNSVQSLGLWNDSWTIRPSTSASRFTESDSEIYLSEMTNSISIIVTFSTSYEETSSTIRPTPSASNMTLIIASPTATTSRTNGNNWGGNSAATRAMPETILVCLLLMLSCSASFALI